MRQGVGLIFEILIGILIILFILGFSFFLMYWGIKRILKSQNSIRTSDQYIMQELYTLKERVELLERNCVRDKNEHN